VDGFGWERLSRKGLGQPRARAGRDLFGYVLQQEGIGQRRALAGRHGAGSA
jgi:hypothetical protein